MQLLFLEPITKICISDYQRFEIKTGDMQFLNKDFMLYTIKHFS